MISLMARLHFDLEISEDFSRVTLDMYCYIKNRDNKIFIHQSSWLRKTVDQGPAIIQMVPYKQFMGFQCEMEI